MSVPRPAHSLRIPPPFRSPLSAWHGVADQAGRKRPHTDFDALDFMAVLNKKVNFPLNTLDDPNRGAKAVRNLESGGYVSRALFKL